MIIYDYVDLKYLQILVSWSKDLTRLMLTLWSSWSAIISTEMFALSTLTCEGEERENILTHIQ